MAEWGLMPDKVALLVRQRYWDKATNLRKLMLGARAFPITINLKVPTDKQILSNVPHFQDFVAAWRQFPALQFVEWQDKNYRSLRQQNVPMRLRLNNMQALIYYLGESAIKRSQGWQQRMQGLLALDKRLYSILIKHLLLLESMSLLELGLMAKLLPQLSANMGRGLYLRALPLIAVDTKFVESYDGFIADCLDVMHAEQISQSGGLRAWLGCLENPKGWLMVRPLCAVTQQRLGGFSSIKTSIDQLRQQALPAQHILVVENIQSGLALPIMADTIAVIGGGGNVSWMDGLWLQDKHVGYWGDIDSWGLDFLSAARQLAPNLESIMMDVVTLKYHRQLMVLEPRSCPRQPACLSGAELDLLALLVSRELGGNNRLEQERLAVDYCHDRLLDWLGCSTLVTAHSPINKQNIIPIIYGND